MSSLIIEGGNAIFLNMSQAFKTPRRIIKFGSTDVNGHHPSPPPYTDKLPYNSRLRKIVDPFIKSIYA